MKETIIFEEITALADGEITEPVRAANIKKQIKENPELEFEFNINRKMKNLLKDRFSEKGAPSSLRKSIIAELHQGKSTHSGNNGIKKIIEQSWEIFQKPRVAFPFTIAAAVILFLSIPFNSIDPVNLIKNQKGEFNLFSQSHSQYTNILQGNLGLQFESEDPLSIKSFFKSVGIEYETDIPSCDNWNLEGAAVSDCRGEKLAFHVYRDKTGKILYVSQVDKKCITQEKKMELSKSLQDYLNSNEYLKADLGDCCAFLLQSKDKYYTLITNGSSEAVENNILSQLK